MIKAGSLVPLRTLAYLLAGAAFRRPQPAGRLGMNDSANFGSTDSIGVVFFAGAAL